MRLNGLITYCETKDLEVATYDINIINVTA
jgi:hypothetical protein